MLHTEVVFLDLTIYYSIQKWKLFVPARLLFNINTILTKKVQIYFEVMINYIIAVISHVRRNNVSLLVCVLASFLFHGWYYYCHEFILDWLCLHSWTQTLWIKQGVSDLHWHRFCSCHDVSPQFSSVKAGRQQVWVRQQKFCLGCSCSTFDRAEQFFIAELH